MKKLQEILFDLPIYGSQGCADSDCTRPAVIRHPETGKFYCAGHAWQLAGTHPVEMEDLTTVALVRFYLLEHGEECEFCEKPAERICSGCVARICFDHFKLIPRTGCACPDCSEAVEQESEASA